MTVGLSKFCSSFEVLSASKTSVMSKRGVVEVLLVSWPSGTLDNDLARCLSLATALGNERRMLNPGLEAVCTESDPLPDENVRSPWPAPLSSPLAVLAFAPISHATKSTKKYTADDAGHTRWRMFRCAAYCATYRRIEYSAARSTSITINSEREKPDLDRTDGDDGIIRNRR